MNVQFGSQNTQQSRFERLKRWRPSRRKLVLIAIVSIAAVGLSVFFFPEIKQTVNSWLGKGDCTKARRQECELMREGVKLLDGSKVRELGDVVQKIRKYEDYKDSSGLMYIVVVFDINMSDVQAAKKDIELLKTAYRDKQYDPVISRDAPAPDVLEQEILNIAKIEEAQRKSGIIWGVKNDQ